MFILGISALYHDSAAGLIEDSNIIAAIQEERITRVIHDSSFPLNSIQYILKKIILISMKLIMLYTMTNLS